MPMIGNPRGEAAMIVAGIDVGGRRKGFHGVLLANGRYLEQYHSHDPALITAWCRQHGAQLVGVDSPCRWNTRRDQPRSSELALLRAGIACFVTPTCERAAESPFYAWMFGGMQLFACLEAHFPLFDGHPEKRQGPACFETYPYAVARVLGGKELQARNKKVDRQAVLRQAGIATEALANQDFVDAGLCALAAWRLAQGRYQSFGEAGSALIVVPSGELPGGERPWREVPVDHVGKQTGAAGGRRTDKATEG